MFTDPRLVHAAADFRRGALLAEAAANARGEPRRSRSAASIPVRWLVMGLCDAVSRIVDDFEPWPGARLPRAARGTAVVGDAALR